MTDFLVWLIISSLWIWGFNYAFQDGEILSKPGNYIRKHLPKAIVKPTIGCVKCMASVHGTAWYLLSGMPYHVLYHILFVVCICGLNDIIDGLTAEYE